MGHILRSARLRWLGHWGWRLIDSLNFWFLGHRRELDSILLQGRVDIVEKWQCIPLFFFKSDSPLLNQIHNFLKNLQKIHEIMVESQSYTSGCMVLLLRITTSTCMKSLLPMLTWKDVAHLSMSMSSKPSAKNITFASLVSRRFRIWYAAVLPLSKKDYETIRLDLTAESPC
jgi:hypothetical protein